MEWEYLVAYYDGPADLLQDWLNKKGVERWELIIMAGNAFIFKRDSV